MAQITSTEIDVNAYYFAGKDIKSFPRRVHIGDQTVTFNDGLRVRVERGGELMYFYDMLAEGGNTYRLRQAGNQWTLLEAR